MIRCFALAFPLLLLLAAASAGAEAPLSRTTPSHLPPIPPGGYELPLAPPLMQFPLRPRMVILTSSQPWRKFGRIDKKLSEACAARSFTERFPMQYRAVFEKKDILGVAFGHGANLYDAGALAERDKIYLFRNGDSTGCVVVVMTPDELKAANEADSKAPAPKKK